jgi:rhamnulokinase
LSIASRLLFIPDLINFWLTGEKVNEETIASTSQLLDPRTRSWAAELIERLSLPAGLFGPIASSGTLLGRILPDIRTETGAEKLAVVAPGCHDTASAVAAVPATGDSHAFLSSGTWSLMGMESKSPIIDDKSLKYSFSNEAGVCGTIRFLKNISGLWIVQECRNSWASRGMRLPTTS